MYGSRYTEKVAEVAGPGADIGKRNRVAMQLLEAESDEFKAAFDAELEEMLADDTKRYKDAETGMPSANPEEQAK